MSNADDVNDNSNIRNSSSIFLDSFRDWTEYEHQQFEAAQQLFANPLDHIREIADYVGTRTPEEVELHARAQFADWMDNGGGSQMLGLDNLMNSGTFDLPPTTTTTSAAKDVATGTGEDRDNLLASTGCMSLFASWMSSDSQSPVASAVAALGDSPADILKSSLASSHHNLHQHQPFDQSTDSNTQQQQPQQQKQQSLPDLEKMDKTAIPAEIDRLLDANVQLIAQMRENLNDGRLQANQPLMRQFTDQSRWVQKASQKLPAFSRRQLPVLPVQINTSLLTMDAAAAGAAAAAAAAAAGTTTATTTTPAVAASSDATRARNNALAQLQKLSAKLASGQSAGIRIGSQTEATDHHKNKRRKR